MTRELKKDKIITTTRMIAIIRAFLLMGLLPFQNFPDTFFRPAAWKHHLMSAADAFELDIHTDAGNREPFFTAGVLLFHLYQVAQP